MLHPARLTVLAASLLLVGCVPGAAEPSAGGGSQPPLPAPERATGGAGGLVVPPGTGGAPGTDGAGAPVPADAAAISPDSAPIPGDATAAETAAPGPASDPGTEGDGDFTINGPYEFPPEAAVIAGVPVGKLETFNLPTSVGFPGIARNVSVYIPAQYLAGTEAALMVIQDGDSANTRFRYNVVLDNLIHKKELPVMVAVFIGNGGDRNRSLEYDSLGGRYTKFVLEEVLPQVVQRYPVKLTADPDGRAAGGHSSGGIAAFTMGWERPDQFRRILTQNGSFTNIRGGNAYPGLVRKADPKPLRVFLFTGSGDQGNWAPSNRNMAAALKEKQYHYRFVFANGGTHNQMFAASILPDTLRWLWRGYPR